MKYYIVSKFLIVSVLFDKFLICIRRIIIGLVRFEVWRFNSV